jgi:hypothetical protein
MLACTLKGRARLSQADELSQRHKDLLGRLSGVLSAGGVDWSVLSAMTMDHLETLAFFYPDLLTSKVRLEDELFEGGLRGSNPSPGPRTLSEARFALIGRVEVRRDQGEGLSDSNGVHLSDVMIWPPRASARLVAQLHEAKRRALEPANTLVEPPQGQGTDPERLDRKVYLDWYGADASPRFELARCAPRFDPGEYIKEADDLAAALVRSLVATVRPPVAVVHGDSSSAETEDLRPCAGLFGPHYNRWELDFFVIPVPGPSGDVRYHQEIHVRTRMFWLWRLFNGPLNGKQELQRTAVFRSVAPLPRVVDLRIFGNISSPKPLTLYNHDLTTTFDDVTRDRILANFGVRFADLKNRIVTYAQQLGIQSTVRTGHTIDDVTALFKLARLWHFLATVRRHTLNAASVVTASGLLAHGLGELAAYEVVDALVPSAVAHSPTTAFTQIVVPGAVLTRRAIDTLEVDYLLAVLRSSRNPALAKWFARMQVLDFAMAGIAVADGSLFLASNWKDVITTLYTAQLVQALTEVWTVYRQGSAVPREIYGELLREQAHRFRRDRQRIERFLSSTRDKWLQHLQRRSGLDADLVERLTRVSEQLRNLELLETRGIADDEEGSRRVLDVWQILSKRAYCDVLSNPDLRDLLDSGPESLSDKGRSLPPEVGWQNVQQLSGAYSCPDNQK